MERKGERPRVSNTEVLGCCHCATSISPPSAANNTRRESGARQQRSGDTHHPVPALRQGGRLSEDLLSARLLAVNDLQGDGDFKRKQPSGLIADPDVRAESRYSVGVSP